MLNEIKCLCDRNLEHSLHDNRYNSEALQGWYEEQKELSVKGIPILSDIIGSETFMGMDFGFSSNGFWGGKSRQHVLNLPGPIGGFYLHEPQVTSALSFLLDKELIGREEAEVNLASFLRCLPLKAENEPKSYGFPTLSSSDFDQIKDPEIDKEVVTKNKKRLDLLIQWRNKDDKLCAIVIEVKIEHKITKGQLGAYGQYLKEKVKPNKCNFYIIALDDANLKEKKKFDQGNFWKTIRWEKTLRNWENELSKNYSLKCPNSYSENIIVTQNNLLRRAIWQATYERTVTNL